MKHMALPPTIIEPSLKAGHSAVARMQRYLSNVVLKLAYPHDNQHRYLMLAHLFDDTWRMLEALEPVVEWDAVISVPYSSKRPGLAERWSARFGERVHLPKDLVDLERVLVEQIARSLALCRRHGQRLIVQDTGGFITPLLCSYFAEETHLVKGVVEITKQGVWRGEGLDLPFPLLHCADSELKRLEALRCGETIARCLDGLTRELGLSLAGRFATVVGAGWIGSGVARALRRLDMVVGLVDSDPLKLAEARLDGFAASEQGDWVERSDLIVGATGRTAVTSDLLDQLPDGALVASGSSRQLEIDLKHLRRHPSERINPALEIFHMPARAASGTKRLLLVNDGFPANFIPGAGSVADEIVEIILAELIVLMRALAAEEPEPGLHRIRPEQERLCARLWLELRDPKNRGLTEPRSVQPRLTPPATEGDPAHEHAR